MRGTRLADRRRDRAKGHATGGGQDGSTDGARQPWPSVVCKRPRFGHAAAECRGNRFLPWSAPACCFHYMGRGVRCPGWSRRNTSLPIRPRTGDRPPSAWSFRTAIGGARHRSLTFPFNSPRQGGAAGFLTRTEPWIWPVFRSRFIHGNRHRASPLPSPGWTSPRPPTYMRGRRWWCWDIPQPSISPTRHEQSYDRASSPGSRRPAPAPTCF